MSRDQNASAVSQRETPADNQLPGAVTGQRRDRPGDTEPLPGTNEPLAPADDANLQRPDPEQEGPDPSQYPNALPPSHYKHKGKS